jgi:O-antigen/teichoic acid export membrane protein
MSRLEQRIGRLSVLIYTGLSVIAALLFLLLARWTGQAPPLAIVGGTVWVFILSMIVSMPLVTGWVKQRKKES